MKTTFVIMAGGRGERLWPLVRARRPKVCLSAGGRRTLLQATIDRLRPVQPNADWLIVTTREQAVPVRAALPPSLRRAVLVEPQIKNTAACITLAAVTVAARDPQRVMVVVPADHWIGDVSVFRRSLEAAIRASAAHDTIATIGIRPTHAHPGLGYLCAGSLMSRAGGIRVFRLSRFVEKPSAAVARRLLRQGRTYWNSGMFIGTAEAFLERVTEWLPQHTQRLAPLAKALRGAANGRSAHSMAFAALAQRAYRTLQPISFDHGVMDHLQDGLVVEGRFAWEDLGSWDTWARFNPSSQRVTIDCENVTVVTQEPHLVAAVGVSDLVIIHTPSATLICSPSKTQAVRDVVKRVSKDPRLASYR
jgi:mannose-1-phosphate guanylyltransferase/mannose-6-phosphate isomerase